jgi:TorA maturation chaperone TorD
MSNRSIDRIAARADLCRLLAACYYQPEAALSQERVFEQMRQAAGTIGPSLAQAALPLGTAFSSCELEELLVDYTQLFLGPVQAPARPYGSVWLPSGAEPMQASTMAVSRLYEEGGFDVDDEFRDLPDHVAVELEFLYQLLFRGAQSQQKADADGVETARALRKRFLDEHLGRWVEPFTTAMRANARTDFYRCLADLTREFVREEAGFTVAA